MLPTSPFLEHLAFLLALCPVMASCSSDLALDGSATPIADASPADTPSDASFEDGKALEADGGNAPLPDVWEDAADATQPDQVVDDSAHDEAPGDEEAGTGEPNAWFDMPLIRAPSEAQCSFTNRSVRVSGTTLLDTWQLTYKSMEYVNGVRQPILIRGYAARPAMAGAPLPGIVLSHGLGGKADLDHAASLAHRTGMFVISYSGPGSGDTPETQSEGVPPTSGNWYRLFDTGTDARGSWFWAHAVAAMRALVCLETRPDVDATRLGMTGYSGGAVATLIAAGVDDRVRAAVPISGSHAWATAALAPGVWWHDLLEQAGLTVASTEWSLLQSQLIDPAASAAHASGAVLMVNGSADEFFPLTAHVATFDAIPHGEKRTSLVGNYDHGCFVHGSVEPAETVQDRASLRIDGGQAMWFKHWFGTDPAYAYLPSPPELTMQPQPGSVSLKATVDPGGASLEVEQVAFWFSVDDSYSWGGLALEKTGSHTYEGVLPLDLPADTVSFVDVQYSTKSFVNPGKFSISSVPAIPSGCSPIVRDMQTCQ